MTELSSSSTPTTPRGSITDMEDYGTVEVTERCCGAMACRVLAPHLFLEAKHGAHEDSEHDAEDPNFTYVGRPIKDESELRQVRRAVKACPFQAIRMRRGKKGASVFMEDAEAVYPLPVDARGEVHLLGFYSPKNAGASCYLIVRPKGNVLVDCPRPDKALIQSIKALGGAAFLVFTHKDHTAFHREWSEAFPGLKRVLHVADVVEATNHFFLVNTADVEVKIAGEKTQPLDAEGDVILIPIPGHTAGSCAILYRERFLFTGDSLHWSQPRGHLVASRLHCWQSWRLQTASLAKLRDYQWTHVLPGHGDPHEFASVAAAHEALDRGRAWMAEQPAGHTSFYRFGPWLQLKTYGGVRMLPKWVRWTADKILAPVGAPGTALREKVLQYLKGIFVLWLVTRILPRLLSLRRPKVRPAMCHLPWGHPLLVAEK